MIFKFTEKGYGRLEKPLFLVLERNIGARNNGMFVAIYDDEEKAKHLNGGLAVGAISDANLLKCMEEYHEGFVDNSMRREIIDTTF